MEKKGNDLQEELRSSQVYKVLTGSGIPVAGKIAQGLGKAAQGLDQALNLGGNTAQGRNTGHPYQAPPTRGYYQAPPQNGGYRPPQQGAAPNLQPPQNHGGQTGNGYYHYGYANRQQPGQPTVSQSKAQRQAAANRAAAAQHAARQQAAAAQKTVRTKGKPQPAPGVPMKMVRKGSPAKFYITAVAAFLYALSAPLYEPQHFVIFAAVLVLVFLVSGALFKGKKEFVPVEP